MANKTAGGRAYTECPDCRRDWQEQVTSELRSLLSEGLTLEIIAKECGIDVHYWAKKLGGEYGE